MVGTLKLACQIFQLPVMEECTPTGDQNLDMSFGNLNGELCKDLHRHRDKQIKAKDLWAGGPPLCCIFLNLVLRPLQLTLPASLKSGRANPRHSPNL